MNEIEEVKRAANRAYTSKDKLEKAVKNARKAGETWTSIGEALGISRQGTWKRYRKVDDEDGET